MRSDRPLCPHCGERHSSGIAFSDCSVVQDRSWCVCAEPIRKTVFFGNAVECGRCRLGIPGDPRMT